LILLTKLLIIFLNTNLPLERHPFLVAEDTKPPKKIQRKAGSRLQIAELEFTHSYHKSML
ncbi:hypothetical protein, partial [Chryseobacterium koreense]|uniref:hypothetical protein n=1 Tax=Chryseobacterium koreense TaxID=232216 RepID=UPI0026EC19BB